MNRRLFTAINLPESIKEQLASYQAEWPELPSRWTKQENIHITLVFLGSTREEEIKGICETMNKVSKENGEFFINLTKICYGPPKKIPPRMVWALGEKSEELGKLQNQLENSLLNYSAQEISKKKSRPYAPHITLARIRQWDFKRMEPEERPHIDKDISIGFKVKSMELMESQLKRTGAEYTVLQSFPLMP